MPELSNFPEFSSVSVSHFATADQKQLWKKELIMAPEGESVMVGVGVAAGTGSGEIVAQPHTGSRECEQEVGQG